MASKNTLMNIELDIARVTDISPHERVDVERAGILKKRIFKDGYIDQPLIIEDKTSMILDGTHRHYIFLNSGIPLVPVLRVSYENNKIKIGCWYRIYKNFNDKSLNHIVSNDEKHINEDSNKGRIYLYKDGSIRKFIPIEDLEVPEAIYHLEILNREGFMCYSEKPYNPYRYISIGYDPPTKEYVVKRFNEGRLFPVKYTRHLLPARIVNLKMPLKHLYDHRKAYSYINNIILTPYKVKIYMEDGYEERYFIAERRG